MERLAYSSVWIVVGMFIAARAEAQTPSVTSSSARSIGSIVAPKVEIPSATSLPGSRESSRIFIKPGHFAAVQLVVRAEGETFRGQLQLRLVSDLDEAAPEPTLQSDRAAIVPPKETRELALAAFVPYQRDLVDFNAALQQFFKLRLRSTLSRIVGAEAYQAEWPLSVLRNHQSLMVVLTARSEDYVFLPQTDVVKAPGTSFELADNSSHFRVVVADDAQRAALPESMLEWTTVAYVIWDGYAFQRLTPAQHQALIDWLHWGGRLIVAGNEAPSGDHSQKLTRLFPARVQGTRTFDAAQLKPLNDAWSSPATPPMTFSHAWKGVELQPAADAEVLVAAADGSPLVVERRVGRGRIVMTAFSIVDRDVVDWRSFDGFLNGCLLRRPSRAAVFRGGEVRLEWADRTSWYDPARTSDVRFAVRDDGRDRPQARDRRDLAVLYGRDLGFGPGTGAWRDDGPIVEAVARTLAHESGITVPGVGFVLAVVGAYFVVLVPLNWLLFRSVGRVEWAWWAAPFVSFGFAAAIVYLAELDIGFSRASTEITIVELQPGYSRAHVSRFMTVYNSLGTSYRITSPDATTLALPFVGGESKQRRSTSFERRTLPESEVTDAARIEIEGFAVESNSAAMLRVEQMHDCGGTVTCLREPDGKLRITNGTHFQLTEIRLSGRGWGRIDRLGPGESVVVAVEAARPVMTPDAETSPSAADGSKVAVDEVQRALIDAAEKELRLTAIAADAVPGLQFDPAPTHRRSAVIVTAHLEYDDAPPQRDLASRASLTP